MHRRTFLRAAAWWGTSTLWIGTRRMDAQQSTDLSAALVVEGKDERLKVVETKPIVLETPLELLAEQRVTPTKYLFVRNNVDLPGTNRLQPLHDAGWMLTIVESPASAGRGPAGPERLTGGSTAPRTHQISVAQLQELPQTSVEMVLQCSGNSRSLMSQRAPIKGTAWDRGGVGNVVFRGVRLASVFERLGVRIAPHVRFVTADGRDVPGTPEATAARDKKDFEHSLPVDEALRHSLLALELNGEPLPPIHGGPLRLVTPGYYGTMHIKWLSTLRLDATESTQESHFPRYRVPSQVIEPGREFPFTWTNSRPNWRMNVKSIVFSPQSGATIRPGAVTVRGAAFNDGECEIETVLLSWDQGVSWRPAKLERPESLYAWTPWELTAELRAGQHEVWARAIDRQGRTQPFDGTVFWNPGGYEWNGVEKIRFTCA